MRVGGFLILSTALADPEKLSLMDSKTRFTGLGHPGPCRASLNADTQQLMPHGFYWITCPQALSERAGTLGDTLALSGTGGELISAQ